MFWEVYMPQFCKSYYFKSRENAIKYSKQYLSKFYSDPKRNEELLKEFEERDCSFVKRVLYLTERSFED